MQKLVRAALAVKQTNTSCKKVFASSTLSYRNAAHFANKNLHSDVCRIMCPSLFTENILRDLVLASNASVSRIIAYVEGNSCRIYTVLKQCCTLCKGICTGLFCCFFIYCPCLLWIYNSMNILCIYV